MQTHTVVPKMNYCMWITSRKIHLTILIWGSSEWCPVPPVCLWPPERRCCSPEAARQPSSAAWGPRGCPGTWLLLHVPHNYGTNRGTFSFKKINKYINQKLLYFYQLIHNKLRKIHTNFNKSNFGSIYLKPGNQSSSCFPSKIFIYSLFFWQCYRWNDTNWLYSEVDETFLSLTVHLMNIRILSQTHMYRSWEATASCSCPESGATPHTPCQPGLLSHTHTHKKKGHQ